MKITSPQLAPYRALLAIALLLAAAFSLLTAGDSAHAQTAVPAAPTGLTAPPVAHNSVTLSWDDPGDTSITGYRILRRDPVNQAPGVFSTIVSNTGSAATSYTDGTVAAKTRYVYRVKAINAAGLSGQSNYVNAETPATPVSPSAPAKPTGLTDASVSHDSVALTWDDPGDSSITGYQVLRRSRDGDDYGDGEGAAEFVAIVDDTGSSDTTYTDTSVMAHTRYVYRVKAKNSAGLSPLSNYANAETDEAPAEAQNAPAKPTGLAVSEALENSVTFVWDDPDSSSITHYKVLRSEGDSGPFTTIEENTGSADTSYTDATVSADTGYEYRLIAVNGNGASPESDSLSVSTPPEATFTFVEVPPEEPEEPPIAEEQQESTSPLEKAIRERLILNTRVVDAPVYMGKTAFIEVSYGSTAGGLEILNPVSVRFYHDGDKIAQARSKTVIISQRNPTVATYQFSMPREEGPYNIKTCVEAGSAKRCDRVTIDIRNLVRDKYVVDGPNIVDPDGDQRGHIQFQLRNNDNKAHYTSVYLYYSEDDTLSTRNDHRVFFGLYQIDADGGSIDITREQRVLVEGYYFLRVIADSSPMSFMTKYEPPPTPAVLDLDLTTGETTSTSAEFDLEIRNPRARLTFYTWLVETKVINEAPYLVYEDLSYTSRRVTVDEDETANITIVDNQADAPRGIAGYKACVGNTYGERMKCSREVTAILDD